MTVIEVLVAMMLLSFGLLGLAGFSITMTRQYGSSTMQEAAALIVQSRFDSVASIRCQALAPSGTQTGWYSYRGVTESWVIADGNDIKIITDTVRFAQRTRPLVYRSIIPCRD
jgi:Tfp pilus assembly protein PilV